MNGAHADAQVPIDPLAVEVVGNARQLDLAVQRLVAYAQQGAVGHPETEAVGGDSGDLHVQCHGAALEDTEAQRSNQQALLAQINLQTAEADIWQRLDELIGSAKGDKFRKFAQGLTRIRNVGG